jgi:phenylacetate-coenzyme A ligase PaaK-like adenylate-forming protein
MKKFIKNNKYLESIARKIYCFIPYEKRKLDKDFYEFLKLLKENEKKSLDKVKEYQFKRLKEIVSIAYYNTDFYKEKYEKENFHPDDLKNLGDITKIPLLKKDEVRHCAKKMIDRRVDIKSLSKSYTSGTTGKALELYQDKKTSSREWASICYQWERVGYKIGDGRIELRGFIKDERDYIYLPDERVLRINIIKMNNKNIYKIIKKIKQINFEFIHGYPSAIFKFAKILEENKMDYNPKAIMMASEVLYDWQMKIIDKVFNCPKIIHYGQAEKVALGAWTNKRKYSFIPSYGILEYDKDSKELIATGFLNEVMPLIRYQLTDTVEDFSDNPIEKTNILYPVIKNIIGREEDYTYDNKKNLIPPAVVTFPFKQLKFIDAAKIIQNNINDFELILESVYKKDDINLQQEILALVSNFKKLYGNKANFKINVTKKISLGANGNFRWIECKIK